MTAEVVEPLISRRALESAAVQTRLSKTGVAS